MNMLNRIFQFYDKQIKKARVKSLKNINLLSGFLFYEELNVIKQFMDLEDMQ